MQVLLQDSVNAVHVGRCFFFFLLSRLNIEKRNLVFFFKKQVDRIEKRKLVLVFQETEAVI